MEHDNTPEWGTCQHEDCKEPAIPCYGVGNHYPNDPDDLLCPAHAVSEGGYCSNCGQVGPYAGPEYDPVPDWLAGLCRDCQSEAWSNHQDDTAIHNYYHGGRG